MKAVQDIGLILVKVVLFFLLSLIFLPAFLIVTYLQDTWSKQLGDLFNV